MVVLQGGQVPEFEIEPDPAKLREAQVTVPAILDAVAKTNMVDSPGLIENNHELSLTLVSGQTHESGGDRKHRGAHHAERRAGAGGRCGGGASVGDAGVHHRDGERKTGRAAEYFPSAGQQHGGGGGGGQRGDRADPARAAAGREDPDVLRSIHSGARFDCQRARRDSDRADSGGGDPGAVPAGLGQLRGGRAGDSGDHRHHADRAGGDGARAST